MADELVHYEVSKGIATITLDSPHNRNALSAQLRRELKAHLTAAAADDAARVIVLTHTGTVFCAGMDLKEAGTAGSESQGVQEFPQILEQLWTSPKPVVARLSGPARAGGVGMVAAADIAVAAENATFAFTEVRIGVVPAVISVTVLPRLLPRAAHELFLTGETFDGKRAAQVGLINSAVPAEQLDAEVRRYTDLLVLGAPGALAATKQMLRREKAATMADDFADMLELSAKHFAGEEGQEGIASFVQKRKANWVPEA
ncbi:enoyl-CoA hydratase-related protein [Labedaea rhizosphaerae]|uniref:Methylglutaconyl-CoA hydratase n=1 Tax=Labedaea rhizosphaerae TaxID=598644 RepID=A0A4R6S8R0_LABRH|nr:enoyl-CoA hydratase-related protein [Labedaea rhizosphaerae]TDP96282.1 methylglutaconyl-CoA hydratase [Labedaea rhizosphaerae]